MVLAAAIGLSRVYLRAHYWSDVAAGWGLGAGIFGLLRERSRWSSSTFATMSDDRRPRRERPHGAHDDDDLDLTTTEITIALAAGVIASLLHRR